MNIQKFLQENNGDYSSARLALLLWVGGVLIVWAKSSITNGQIQAIPESVQVILGILMSGKVVQKFGEGKPAPKSE
ncbi:MAG: hypothetical protein HZC51_03945 [Nitrospirae bacterium]|nr:hypothetical protein [Nitrospirota bacterium]